LVLGAVPGAAEPRIAFNDLSLKVKVELYMLVCYHFDDFLYYNKQSMAKYRQQFEAELK
jgi:Ca2+-binding EF-hand superfamily protein